MHSYHTYHTYLPYGNVSSKPIEWSIMPTYHTYHMGMCPPSLSVTDFDITYIQSSMYAVLMFGASWKYSLGGKFNVEWSTIWECVLLAIQPNVVRLQVLFATEGLGEYGIRSGPIMHTIHTYLLTYGKLVLSFPFSILQYAHIVNGTDPEFNQTRRFSILQYGHIVNGTDPRDVFPYNMAIL